MTKRKTRMPLPPAFEPRLPARERARLAARDRYYAARRALLDAFGEEAVREAERAAKAAAARKNNAARWAALTPEQRSARMSALGRLGGGAKHRDKEKLRAHMARLGRINAVALNARMTAEEKSERSRRGGLSAQAKLRKQREAANGTAG